MKKAILMCLSFLILLGISGCSYKDKEIEDLKKQNGVLQQQLKYAGIVAGKVDLKLSGDFTLSVHDIEIDFEGYSAKKNGNNIDLKPKEIKLLELLLKYSGKVLTRTQILDNIWNIEESPNDRVIDVYIKNIRKKLELDCIITVKGIGYKFEEM